MFRSGISFSTTTCLALGSALLAAPIAATAQRHGGGSTIGAGGGLSGYSRPDGVDEKDSLKDFHQTLALQASSQQIADFQSLIKSIETAQAELQAFLQRLRKESGVPDASGREALDRALENARTGGRRFQGGFSPAQNAGLKDIAKRLAKSESDLDQEQKRLDQSLDAKAPEVSSQAESLDKALTEFYNEQLALGREMSITLANGQDLAFTLPAVRRPVRIAKWTIPVTVSGVLSQTAAAGNQRTFKLDLMTDLSELQQNITELLRAQLDTSEACGQRVSIREARLTPAAPASLLVVRLHFERWMCAPGQQISTELSEGDGTVEIKLTAAVEKENSLTLKPAFGRIEANGMLGDQLRSGSLGEDLQDKAVQAVLSAVRAGADFKVALPPAVRNSATLQTAKFREVGVGGLSVVLTGQVEISNEQADQLASQLNQTLSAQRAAAQ
jgi:hypothetical protein